MAAENKKKSNRKKYNYHDSLVLLVFIHSGIIGNGFLLANNYLG